MNNEGKKVLIVDDEASIRRNITDLLLPLGHETFPARDGEEAVEVFAREKPDLVIMDINLPVKDGLQALVEIKAQNRDIPVIVFTAFGTSERAIKAMKAGAYDYIEKPFDLDEFLIIIDRALQYGNLLAELKKLRSLVDQPEGNPENTIIGKSSGMREIYKLIGRVAQTDATVLIQGESGTGKELFADAIQRHSQISDKPYVKINCGAIAESLLESEIFGHEKGSFTGALAQRKGLFEMADGGTVFLDEINSMPLSLQVKLLRVLQKQPFFRVGGNKPVHVDIRIIASSNKDIKQEVEAGRFREDLYYRLNVVLIKVPPLRERFSDLVFLVEHFVNRYSPKHKMVITKENIRKLMDYHWPGNVRELENYIHSAIVTSSGEFLNFDQLPASESENDLKTDYLGLISEGQSLREVLTEVEKQIVFQALRKYNNNQSKTADFLKMNRRLLYSRLQEWT